jgi:hypothetical protein
MSYTKALSKQIRHILTRALPSYHSTTPTKASAEIPAHHADTGTLRELLDVFPDLC